MVRYPPLVLGSRMGICAMPPFATYRAMVVRAMPTNNKHERALHGLVIFHWSVLFVLLLTKYQKNPRAHKNKIGTPPPPPQTPPQKRGILRTWFFLQKERIFPGVHKIGAPHFRPQNCGHEFYGHEDFSENSRTRLKGTRLWRKPEGSFSQIFC